MYYNDHAPPHLHARYAGQEIRVNILSGHTLSGRLPGRAEQRVMKCLEPHRGELMADWRLAAARKPLFKIEPLEQLHATRAN